MLNGDGNDNGKSINISNEQKKKPTTTTTTLQMQHSFFVHFFAVVLYDFNVKPSLKLPSLNNSRFLYNRNRRV